MTDEIISLFPYCELDGVRTLPDSFVENLYLRAEEEGLADMVFMDGSLNDSRRFLEDMKTRSHLFIILDGDEAAGFTWLNHFQQRTAYFHFCLFRDFWGAKVKGLEQASIKHLLHLKDDNGYLFDMLLGNVAKKNRAACRRAKQSCMTIMGELPYGDFDASTGESIPSILSYVTRESLEVAV
ncbi:hypothetical protein [Maridesulfovibrio ferrireducens]|uniref:hypothetical protein n=1 Tax=Maridesulfovibrio ferrireducens TaxID=246191 RepID=UPI001A2F5137|nr:hypothetical protein [Maridesulfovibrio ferrireducens]MBI9113168.1 hypothetical protein [Maridesulfovibrio ferrireducens]